MYTSKRFIIKSWLVPLFSLAVCLIKYSSHVNGRNLMRCALFFRQIFGVLICVIVAVIFKERKSSQIQVLTKHSSRNFFRQNSTLPLKFPHPQKHFFWYLLACLFRFKLNKTSKLSHKEHRNGNGLKSAPWEKSSLRFCSVVAFTCACKNESFEL